MSHVADIHRRHAEWAKEMAAEYREMVDTTTSEFWRSKWTETAIKMEAEAAFFGSSAEYFGRDFNER